jgi:hypothetical protein
VEPLSRRRAESWKSVAQPRAKKQNGAKKRKIGLITDVQNVFDIQVVPKSLNRTSPHSSAWEIRCHGSCSWQRDEDIPSHVNGLGICSISCRSGRFTGKFVVAPHPTPGICTPIESHRRRRVLVCAFYTNIPTSCMEQIVSERPVVILQFS